MSRRLVPASRRTCRTRRASALTTWRTWPTQRRRTAVCRAIGCGTRGTPVVGWPWPGSRRPVGNRGRRTRKVA